MLGTTLEKKLKELKDRKILVVMDDGMAFLGSLEDFDKETLILKDVSQGSATEIDWGDLSEIYEEDIDRDEEISVGFINWVHINMEEVYIRVSHISRIWKWHERREKKKEEEVEEKRAVAKRPVYRRNHDIPNIGSSYDMPEGW